MQSNNNPLKETKEREKYIEELVEEVKNDFLSRQQERLKIERSWELNMNFLSGNQYCNINFKGEITEEDKEFFSEETRAMSEIAPLYNILHKCLKDNTTLIEKIIFFKYFLYETDEPFMPQFKRNNRVLKDELERIINKYTDIYGG